jgi:hypothetical protein
MKRLALYPPLAAHLVPTLAIGCLVLIPQSCIAGFNELAIGFAAANLGFVLSYLAGVRLAVKKAAAPRPARRCGAGGSRSDTRAPISAPPRRESGSRRKDTSWCSSMLGPRR